MCQLAQALQRFKAPKLSVLLFLLVPLRYVVVRIIAWYPMRHIKAMDHTVLELKSIQKLQLLFYGNTGREVLVTRVKIGIGVVLTVVKAVDIIRVFGKLPFRFLLHAWSVINTTAHVWWDSCDYCKVHICSSFITRSCQNLLHISCMKS